MIVKTVQYELSLDYLILLDPLMDFSSTKQFGPILSSGQHNPNTSSQYLDRGESDFLVHDQNRVYGTMPNPQNIGGMPTGIKPVHSEGIGPSPSNPGMLVMGNQQRKIYYKPDSLTVDSFVANKQSEFNKGFLNTHQGDPGQSFGIPNQSYSANTFRPMVSGFEVDSSSLNMVYSLFSRCLSVYLISR